MQYKNTINWTNVKIGILRFKPTADVDYLVWKMKLSWPMTFGEHKKISSIQRRVLRCSIIIMWWCRENVGHESEKYRATYYGLNETMHRVT